MNGHGLRRFVSYIGVVVILVIAASLVLTTPVVWVSITRDSYVGVRFEPDGVVVSGETGRVYYQVTQYPSANMTEVEGSIRVFFLASYESQAATYTVVFLNTAYYVQYTLHWQVQLLLISNQIEVLRNVTDEWDHLRSDLTPGWIQTGDELSGTITFNSSSLELYTLEANFTAEMSSSFDSDFFFRWEVELMAVHPDYVPVTVPQSFRTLTIVSIVAGITLVSIGAMEQRRRTLSLSS